MQSLGRGRGKHEAAGSLLRRARSRGEGVWVRVGSDGDRSDRLSGDGAVEWRALHGSVVELRSAVYGEEDPEKREDLIRRLRQVRKAISQLERPIAEGTGFVQGDASSDVVSDEGVLRDTLGSTTAPGGRSRSSGGSRRDAVGEFDDLPDSLEANGAPLLDGLVSVKRRAWVRRRALVAFLIALWVVGVLGSAVLSSLVLSRTFGVASDRVATSQNTIPVVEASPEAEDRVGEIAAVLQGLGMSDVEVEIRDSGVQLSGTVATEAERDSAVEVTRVLLGDQPFDASELVVQDVSVEGP